MADTDYATVAEFKAESGMTSLDYDGRIQAALNAAARGIDNFCNRSDGSFMADASASARYYPGSGKAHQWIDECVEVTAVAVKGSASDDEDAYVAWTVGAVGTTAGADVFPATGDPRCPEFGRTPYTLLVVGLNGSYSIFTRGSGTATVKVTARWGYATTVPSIIKEATLALAARWFKQGQSGWADTLASAELGQLIYQKENSDIRFMLVSGRYIKPTIGRR